MKKFKSLVLAVLVILSALFTMTIGASAKGNSADYYQSSSVLIMSTVKYEATNYKASFTMTSTGTGFAVGMPGEKVQYIGTCNHVVQEPEGVYILYVDPVTGEYVDCIQAEEGTKYPFSTTTTINGKTYDVYIDYFNTKTEDLVAIFSAASNSYVSLSTVQYDKDKDVALCKLACDPIDTLQALPLQLKNDTELNTDVIAVGYPGVSKYFNSEARYDKSDSTLKDGIISKFQHTSGMNDSKITFDTYEISAEISQGMSGGPVIAEETGAIVGLSAFMYLDYDQVKSANYAICVDYLANLLEDEGVKYEIYKPDFALPVILVAVAVIVLIVAIILIVVAMKKRNSQNNADFTPSQDFPVSRPAEQPQHADVVTGPTKYRLLGLEGHHKGTKFSMDKPIVMGRKPECNVKFPIDDPGVSGIHCKIEVKKGAFILTDLGSSYGTFVGKNTKIEKDVPVTLNNGDTFRIGDKNVFQVKIL